MKPYRTDVPFFTCIFILILFIPGLASGIVETCCLCEGDIEDPKDIYTAECGHNYHKTCAESMEGQACMVIGCNIPVGADIPAGNEYPQVCTEDTETAPAYTQTSESSGCISATINLDLLGDNLDLLGEQVSVLSIYSDTEIPFNHSVGDPIVELPLGFTQQHTDQLPPYTTQPEVLSTTEQSLVCFLCDAIINDDLYRCSFCDAPYHTQCFDALGQCKTQHEINPDPATIPRAIPRAISREVIWQRFNKALTGSLSMRFSGSLESYDLKYLPLAQKASEQGLQGIWKWLSSKNSISSGQAFDVNTSPGSGSLSQQISSFVANLTDVATAIPHKRWIVVLACESQRTPAESPLRGFVLSRYNNKIPDTEPNRSAHKKAGSLYLLLTGNESSEQTIGHASATGGRGYMLEGYTFGDDKSLCIYCGVLALCLGSDRFFILHEHGEHKLNLQKEVLANRTVVDPMPIPCPRDSAEQILRLLLAADFTVVTTKDDNPVLAPFQACYTNPVKEQRALSGMTTGDINETIVSQLGLTPQPQLDFCFWMLCAQETCKESTP